MERHITVTTKCKTNRNRKMIIYPNAKINIGLYVTEKRPDGYHNIETIFYPIPLYDILEFIKSPTKQFTISGIPSPTDNSNLVIKIYEHFRKHYNIPTLAIHLHKRIPTQAGLGGGSADAAFFAKALNQYFNLNISTSQLKQIVSIFGSDCPFFIDNTPSFATGRGDILTPITTLSLKEKYLVIIKPQIHISTVEAYKNITPMQAPHHLNNIITRISLNEWKHTIKNDFETFAFNKFPELAYIKEKLYKAEAKFVQMSGSGSAIFAIFEKQIPEEKLKSLFPTSFTFSILL